MLCFGTSVEVGQFSPWANGGARSILQACQALLRCLALPLVRDPPCYDRFRIGRDPASETSLHTKETILLLRPWNWEVASPKLKS